MTADLMADLITKHAFASILQRCSQTELIGLLADIVVVRWRFVNSRLRTANDQKLMVELEGEEEEEGLEEGGPEEEGIGGCGNRENRLDDVQERIDVIVRSKEYLPKASRVFCMNTEHDNWMSKQIKKLNTLNEDDIF